MFNRKTSPSLVLRVAIPLRSASHGICVAQAISRLYAGVSEVVNMSDRRVVLAHGEIAKIELKAD
jgi:hypothetical protein